MPISHIIGFDDSPFTRQHRVDIVVIGAVYAGLRLDGVLRTHVRRDGANAAERVAQCVAASKWAEHVQLIMFQGVALGGFNVLDVHALHRRLGVPVLVVARRPPHMDAIRTTLLTHVRSGARKWSLIERLGPMEPVAGVFVQRVGLGLAEAGGVIQRFATHGRIPEPLRAAHLIVGGITTGASRGRA